MPGSRCPAPMTVLRSLLLTVRTWVSTRAALQIEILALRHQPQVLERSRPRRLRLSGSDRLLWVWLSRVWQGWRAAVVIVKPGTVIAWHRRGLLSLLAMQAPASRPSGHAHGSRRFQSH